MNMVTDVAVHIAAHVVTPRGAISHPADIEVQNYRIREDSYLDPSLLLTSHRC